MLTNKSIILCADDFGLNDAVSDAILHLARNHRLSAVSCLVNGAAITEKARELALLKPNLSIGMHFNLTEPECMGNFKAQPLSTLLLKSHLSLINRKLIAEIFQDQLNSFVSLFQSPPDFIDGHQHVHTFPLIRDIILDHCLNKYSVPPPFFRSTWPMLPFREINIKSQIIAGCGGKQFKRQLEINKIKHNHFFAGIYNFSPDTDYRHLFCQWLSNSPDKTLIMCHPGLQGADSDQINAARYKEYSYFSSEEFITDCERHQITLVAEKNTW